DFLSFPFGHACILPCFCISLARWHATHAGLRVPPNFGGGPPKAHPLLRVGIPPGIQQNTACRRRGQTVPPSSCTRHSIRGTGHTLFRKMWPPAKSLTPLWSLYICGQAVVPSAGAPGFLKERPHSG